MQTTPLTEWHRQHGAKMAEFGGFLMPIAYGPGILWEHAQVRNAVGLFDVSHMGELLVEGPKAGDFLDYLVTNQPSSLTVGQAQYSPMCYPSGGTVDDLLIYCLARDRYLLVVNAGNRTHDYEWVMGHAKDYPQGPIVRDVSDKVGLLALQGPQSSDVMAHLVDSEVLQVPYYHFRQATIVGHPTLISRTGYTGEDGFELYLEASQVGALWDTLISLGVAPIGLGARDTLRLEARLPLYGHELKDTISPLEAGLGPFIKWDKGPFIGRDALLKQKEEGLMRRLVGLRVMGGIARAGYHIVNPEDEHVLVGEVTSGSMSPTLGYAIALGLVKPEWARLHQELSVVVRGRLIKAEVVKTPFYRRPRPN